MGKRIPLLQNVRTSSGAHTASYEIGTGVLSREGRGEAVRASTHLQLRVEIANKWSCTPASLICLHGMDRDEFIYKESAKGMQTFSGKTQ